MHRLSETKLYDPENEKKQTVAMSVKIPSEADWIWS